VVCSIKELEDLLPQIMAVDAQIAADQKTFEAKVHQEAQEKIEKAQQESIQNELERTTLFLKTLYVLNSMLPNISKIPLPLTEDQYAALSFFRTIISGVGIQADHADAFVDNAHRCLNLYFQRSTETFVNNFTYTDLNALVDNLLIPPVIPKFGLLEPTEEVGLPEPSHTEETPAPTVKTSISFINPSEILGKSDDWQMMVYTISLKENHFKDYNMLNADAKSLLESKLILIRNPRTSV
jgi:hypothetical protein